MTDKPVQNCPKCRKSVRRLIGKGGGIIFKGSGFYQTDYRSESYRKAAEADKKAPTKKADKKAGSGKSKSDASSSSKDAQGSS